jgi:cytochrome P450
MNFLLILSSFAYPQLYLVIAEVFTRFDMELFETDDRTMEWIDTGFLRTLGHVKVRAWPRDLEHESKS